MQAIYDRLARYRAQACADFLKERGIGAGRLEVSFTGRGAHTRVEFVAKPMDDGAAKVAAVTAKLGALPRLLFSAAAEQGLPSVEQLWSVDHLDPARRTENAASVRAAVDELTSAHAEGLYLEVHVEAGARAEGIAGGPSAMAPAALAARCDLHPQEVEAVMESLARFRCEKAMAALIAAGLPADRCLGTFAAAADASSTTLVARTTSWRNTALAAHEEALRGAASPQMVAQAQASLNKLADTAGVIRFHGGAEAEVRKRPALAWDVDHHDPTKRAANAKVFDAVAAVLRAAPGVALEVHVETSKTDAAPRAIAEHLRLDPRRDVQHVMEQLAKLRAQACVDALVARAASPPAG